MSRSPKTQIIGFATAVVVLAGIIAWTGLTAWRHLGQLRKDLGTLQAESFHVADHLEAGILELNQTALRYDLHTNSVDAANFDAASLRLKRWIDQAKQHVNSRRERELLDLIALDLNAYAARAQQFLRGRAVSARQSIPALDMITRDSADYIQHCRQFDEAQQWALGLFGRESHRTTILLQRLLVFEVALLLSFWGAVAVVLYRTMVAPLRAKLIATRGLMERQEKMASLGTLAAGVAHEIRNPLTAIKVRLHGLTKLLPVGSSEEEDAILIGGEIQRLDRIVRDFLEFGRPSEPEFQTVPIADLLSSVHQLFREHLHGSAVEMCIDPGPAATLRVDPQQIEQVLINLVRNAAESIAGHGTITMRAFSERLTLQGRTGPAVVIEVADTGQGIPPDIQKRLFDPFFTTKDGGTGLGLAIAARIVEKHGGMLQFQTRLNRGTTFRLVLPARNSHES